jgi:hypothetical protein
MGRFHLKLPLPLSDELLERVEQALTPKRRPLLIVIDGADGCGKSSLASWLAWQLGIPVVHLDLYNISNHPIQWRTADLARTVSHRLDRRPVIVECVLALDALEQIGRNPGFLIVVNGKGSDELAGQIAAYFSRQNPNAHADFTLDGYDEESPPQ